MSNLQIAAGMKIRFTPTSSVFSLAKVTEARVSWYVDESYKGGSGKNTLKMAWVSMQAFQRGLDNGAYEIVS